MSILHPPPTLGILGGGQLGRMSALSAQQMGIAIVIFCPEEDCPASQIANNTICAEYTDKAALKRFSEMTDFITYEFENIPVETIEYLESLKGNSVYPDKNLLNVSQDRIREKSFLNENGIETARWAAVRTKDDIHNMLNTWDVSGCVIKTTRFGYDGKGQVKYTQEDQKSLDEFLDSAKSQDLIMEELIDFSHEISTIVARDKHNKTVLYGPMLNEHKNHILHKTTFPAGLSTNINKQAQDIAETIANAVNLTGVLTVEYFLCRDGRILVNEIAPRTHNSGHWTIDACAVSQFENHVRCVTGLPVGSSAAHSDAGMLNLIGDDIENIEPYLTQDNANIHLYGKKNIREGRKMGHITFIKNKKS